ncbi:MAG: hypothetical protein V3R34_02225, partial [Hyphomicrobium sp.]
GALRLWLQADLQPPEIDFRLYPSIRHFGQGWERLKVTRLGHSAVSPPVAFKPPANEFPLKPSTGSSLEHRHQTAPRR